MQAADLCAKQSISTFIITKSPRNRTQVIAFFFGIWQSFPFFNLSKLVQNCLHSIRLALSFVHHIGSKLTPHLISPEPHQHYVILSACHVLNQDSQQTEPAWD